MPNSREISSFSDDGVAEKAIDDGAAQKVVFGKAVAAHGGDAAVRSAFCHAGSVAMILRVGVLERADGADAHAVKIGAGLGGIALKIAVQGALALRDGQFVAGLGEMIHADVLVAGARETSRGRSGKFRIFPCLRAGGWRMRPAAF